MPNFIIDVKARGAKKAKNDIDNLVGGLKKAGLQAAAVAVSWETLTSAITKSAEFENVKRGFDNLARSAGFSHKAFESFDKALNGTVDSLTLMKQANNAMLLGIAQSEEQMAQMFDISQRLGQSLGIDTTRAVESLVTGLGRQSKLMLDNLGIMVDINEANEKYALSVNKSTSELTDQEKKIAFTNETMFQAQNLVDMLGEETLSTKDNIAQLTSAVGDLLISFGNLLTPILVPIANILTTIAEGYTSVFNAISSGEETFTGTATGLAQFKAVITNLAKEGNMDKIAEITEQLEEDTNRLNFELGGLSDTVVLINGEEAKLGTILGIVNDQTTISNQLMPIAVENMENWGQMVVDNISGMDEYIEKTNEKVDVEIKDNTTLIETIGNELKLIETKKELIKWILKNSGALDLERQKLIQNLQASSNLASGLGALNAASKGSALVTARLQQASVIASTSAGAMAAITPPTGAPTPAGWLNFAAVIAAGTAQAVNISQAMGDFKKAATGMDEVVTGPTMILAGEAGAEQVSITPLEGPNIDGPQGQGSVNITFSGNVMSQDFIENEAIPQIKEAIRRGADIGMS